MLTYILLSIIILLLGTILTIMIMELNKVKRIFKTPRMILKYISKGFKIIKNFIKKPNENEVDVNKLIKYLDYISSVNDIDFENIILKYNGKEIEISPEEIKEWKYVGLSNKDFITFRVDKNYEDKWWELK